MPCNDETIIMHAPVIYRWSANIIIISATCLSHLLETRDTWNMERCAIQKLCMWSQNSWPVALKFGFDDLQSPARLKLFIDKIVFKGKVFWKHKIWLLRVKILVNKIFLFVMKSFEGQNILLSKNLFFSISISLFSISISLFARQKINSKARINLKKLKKTLKKLQGLILKH